MAASDIITWIVAIAGLAYIAYRIGRGPFVILGRRLTGSLPLRPPGTEPGAERWFAAAGVTMFAGLGIAELVTRAVGYPITALGALLLSYTGVLIVQDHRGAARAFARRSWTSSAWSFLDNCCLCGDHWWGHDPDGDLRRGGRHGPGFWLAQEQVRE